MNWIFLLLALLAGIVLPIQGAYNSKLAVYMQHPVLSAFCGFVIGTISLLLYVLISGISLSQIAGGRHAPILSWSGGILGAFFVTVTILAVPRLGVALTFSLVILGQMLVSLPIDHFGLLGVAVKEINLPRIIGVILVIAGTILVQRF
jgi:bacterial/archaeal transporter family-2 protein